MSESMSDSPPGRQLELAQWVDEVCDRYEAAWQSGWRPRLEDYLGEAPEPQRTNLLHELIRLEVEYGRRQGEALVHSGFALRIAHQTRPIARPSTGIAAAGLSNLWPKPSQGVPAGLPKKHSLIGELSQTSLHSRSRLVKAYLAKHPDIVAETLPSYAPEANPDEGVWGWTKYGRLANLAASNTKELRQRIHEEFVVLKKNRHLLNSFIQEADLCSAA